MTTTSSIADSGVPPRSTAVAGVRYIVGGRVQGVGYRAWTQRLAHEHKVAGNVRNLPDGCVQVDAIGDRNTLSSFRRKLLEGPATAHVISITAAEITLAATSGFEIVY
ncbi:MAG: acylphosphatase [Gemmatimonadota bacterium]|nr:acylphosphatase [Gemmatimonadota bacterium]